MASGLSPLQTLLARAPPAEPPLAGRSTLEVTVYWRHDYLDGLEAGARRRIRVGGTRNNDLGLELPEGVEPFVLAEIRGDRARIHVPEGSEAALRTADGQVAEPSRDHDLRLGERLVFTLGDLTFSLQFVRDHRVRQSLWQRIRPRDL